MSLDVFTRLRATANERPNDPAITVIGDGVSHTQPLTWSQLQTATLQHAARIDTEVSPHGVVILIAPNRPAYAAAMLGTLAANRTVLPADPSLTDTELLTLIEQTGAEAVVAETKHIERDVFLSLTKLALDDVVADVNADANDTNTWPTDAGQDAALLLQSSGTTGGPKIVKRSGPSLDAVARNVAQATGLLPDDRVLAAVPLSHSYGIENGLLAPVWAGATMIHHVSASDAPGRGFDPSLIETSRATVLPGVPAMYEMVDRMQLGRGQLRLAYSAGASLPTAIAESLEQRHGLRLGSLYGATEIGSVTFGPNPATVGQPMQGVDVLILDPQNPDPANPLPPDTEGHVAVRATSMFDGYLHRPADEEDPVVDGYFLTGDLGMLTGDGCTPELVITGRLKLLIDIGGVKVNPLEVEQLLATHPNVIECVVVPDPVSPTINRVKAILTTTDDSVEIASLRSFLRGKLAAHKIPRTFEVRESLPKSPTGKILRRKLLMETA